MRSDRENLRWLEHGVRTPAAGSPVVGVDVCISGAARAKLTAAGYRVVFAYRSEDDVAWYGRAVKRGAKLIISADGDLRRLAAGSDVQVFVPRDGESALRIVERFLRAHPARSLSTADRGRLGR
jgi:hypothetical protein